MKNITISNLILLIVFSINVNLEAQSTNSNADTLINSSLFKGFEFRSIGPAFMSGRIADIAIHPNDENTWYAAAGSGGVWKTKNAGITWDPVFDDQKSYSIGCVTIDPSNPDVVWVGTGENVGGRHVGYGDGIYRSEDGGLSWMNMGLIESHHISKIIIHPNNSRIIWVAAQGPLWYKGGERGLYKTIDGGKTWIKTLGDDEWVGVTDIVIDSRTPERLYAATWQRHRNIAAYLGGGPGTAIYRSEDSGNTWTKLVKGLPTSNMGKIGLAISPQKPDIIYAAIELDRRTGGVFKSTNRGASWEKKSDAVAGATGPHYYQELYACPHNFDRIYLCDVRIQISNDGGKNFKRLNEKYKHSDNHTIIFRMDDPDYLLIGTDGGLYETFDDAQNWRYIANLPLTQYYKVAVDDAEPFYNIYGGTQDNATQGGPSRTDRKQGILNSDWYVVLGGDGHQPATEPGNSNIVYAQSQEGELHRVDLKTGEKVYIKPQPKKDDPYERNNWDAPVLVSPHSPTRIYFGSQRLWKSENRGDSWEDISGDLTKNQERISLPIMEKTWSFDSPWDFNAMSNYNTITSISESPVKEDLIYVGTDDGLLQFTSDGGQMWQKIDIGSIPGIPATSYVNDIKADLFDENTVYVVLDNHKFGDLSPYVIKSTDQGKSWSSIASGLPDRTLVWRIVQDHKKPELLFLGTEFGIYFTLDGGEKWIKLQGGLPTIPFRDLTIQKRENDLVAASFGRSFYVLDDYSALREIDKKQLDNETSLFKPRHAWWYFERTTLGWGEKGSQGAGFYTAPNPPFGALFTYYLKENYKTENQIRKEREKKLIKEEADVQFPGWDSLEQELLDSKPIVQIIIKDGIGNIVKKIDCNTTQGFHRITWDLRYSTVNSINLNHSSVNLFDNGGYLATPGTYSASIVKSVDGTTTLLNGPIEFEVRPLYEGTLYGSSFVDISSYRERIETLQREVSSASLILKELQKKLKAIEASYLRARTEIESLDTLIFQLKKELFQLNEDIYGKKSRREVGEKNNPTFRNRLRVASSGLNSSYGPTPMHRESLEIAKLEFEIFNSQLVEIQDKRIPEIERLLKKAGAPQIEG